MEHDPQVSAAGRKVLAHEGALNEHRVALVRAFAFGTATLVALGYFFVGRRPLLDVVVVGAAALLGLVLVPLIKRHYQPFMRFALPALDAAALTFVLTRRVDHSDGSAGMVGTAAVSCALFAATGGLRFDRRSAAWTTLLALGCLVVSVWRYAGEGLPYMVVAILAVGTLSAWQTSFIQRIVRSEQGRAFLRRFLHQNLLESAFTDPGLRTLQPRQQVATILVSDLRGFTSLAERMDPAAVVELLNELHEAMADVVSANGGVVDKFLGDGMLAVFGAPEPLPEHPARAVLAASRMLEAVGQINARHPERPPLRIGIGIHTGEVVSGVIGGGRRMEFTVIGDTVNIAARLEALTRDHGVPLILSEDTARASRCGPLQDLGDVPVRGRARPVHLYTPGPGFKPQLMDPLSTSSIAGHATPRQRGP